MACSKGIDIQATAACVAGINTQTTGVTTRPNVHEYALHTLLVKFMVIPKTHQVRQQSLLVNFIAGIVNLHTAPVRLTRDQAVAFE